MPSVNLFSNVAPRNVNSDIYIYNYNLSIDVVMFRNVIDRISDIGKRENVGDKHALLDDSVRLFVRYRNHLPVVQFQN